MVLVFDFRQYFSPHVFTKSDAVASYQSSHLHTFPILYPENPCSSVVSLDRSSIGSNVQGADFKNNQTTNGMLSKI